LWYRYSDNQQTDERDRLRENSNIRSQRRVLAVQHEGRLADEWRDARRRRRDDRIYILEQAQYGIAKPAAEFLRVCHGATAGNRAAGVDLAYNPIGAALYAIAGAVLASPASS